MNAPQAPGMSKAPDAFRTISEVAEELDIPQHVLRFWETRFTSIRPLKRGGGRRYYRPDDVELLKGIRQLLYGQGYTIKGVQRILKEEGPRVVQSIGRGGTMPARRPDVEPTEQDGIEPAPRREEPAYAGSAPAFLVPDEAPRMRPAPSVSDGMAGHDPVLAGNDLERLRSALAELLECRRIMESLRRQ
jgi:DNA-binding transcriptional MerR regulator